MLNSTIFDVVIGLVFTFLTVSLATSSVTEAIASAMKWRANDLLQGVKDLLNDQDLSGLGLQIYNHALVNPQASGKAKSESELTTLPSYIDPKHFATALADAADLAKNAPGKIDATLEKVTDQQLRDMLQGISRRADGKLDSMKEELAAWFDAGMEHVSGVYKRRTQWVSLVIALLLCIALNIDALHIGKALWQQPSLAKPILSVVDSEAKNAAQALQAVNQFGLPLGWDKDTIQGRISDCPLGWISMLLGWLIAALSSLFGAPFWFDTLQRFVRLNGTGPQPAQKSTQGV